MGLDEVTALLDSIGLGITHSKQQSSSCSGNVFPALNVRLADCGWIPVTHGAYPVAQGVFVAFGSADIGLQRHDQLLGKTPAMAARDFRQPVVKIVGDVLECDACHGGQSRLQNATILPQGV